MSNPDFQKKPRWYEHLILAGALTGAFFGSILFSFLILFFVDSLGFSLPHFELWGRILFFLLIVTAVWRMTCWVTRGQKKTLATWLITACPIVFAAMFVFG